VSDMELFTACQAEAKEPPINLSAVDPSPFMPPLMGIISVLKMSEKLGSELIRRKLGLSLMTKSSLWTKLKDGKPVIPTMETNK
jgi:hypothetical protein